MDFAEEIESFLASFSPEEVALTRIAFHALLEDRPIRAHDLPAVSGLPGPIVEKALSHLVERGTALVEAGTGKILGIRGLSLVQTDHELVLNAHPYYAWCAVDAVGIPAALSADASVRSRCHHCQSPLTIEFRNGAIIKAPNGLVVWAVERDLSRSLRAHT